MSSEANREVLLAFWKAHILHHAGERGVRGQWVLTELRPRPRDGQPKASDPGRLDPP
jgi:hypothetical protein